jgi:hypothetical protein
MKEKFIVRNEDIRKNCIELISKMDITTPITVNIYDYKKNRTIDQNSLYHMWCKVFSELTGYSQSEQHEVFKSMLLPIIERQVRGVELRELTSTKNLTTKEFADYMKNIEALAVEYGIKLPYPEELIYILK